MPEKDQSDGEQQPATKKPTPKFAPDPKVEPVENDSEDEQIEQVDGEVLANTIERHIEKYVVLSSAQRKAAALWVLHTWAFDAAVTTPYLFVVSPQSNSGKSRLLETLTKLVREPLDTSDASPSSLFRAIEDCRPTVLLDEVDAVLGSPGSERIRGLLDSGNRQGGNYRRSVPAGEGAWESAKFSTFAPKALAGIDSNRFPDTLLNRSIVLRIQRRKKGQERIEPFRFREVEEETVPIRKDTENWADQNMEALTAARPEYLDSLSDRANDAWEPLFAIADQLGGDWPEDARAAAIELHLAGQAMEDTIPLAVLRAIRGFADTRWPTVELLKKLNKEVPGEDASWLDQGNLTAHSLARFLRPFGIKASTIRVGKDTKKGYKRESFEDAWERYLPDDGGGDV